MITVKDFLDVAFTDAIEVIIRENGDGQWIYAYEIGKNVHVGKYDYFLQDGKLVCSGKFILPQKSIEVCRCDFHCKKLIIPKDVRYTPKDVLELEICSFCHSYIPFSDHPFEIWCYPKGWIAPAPVSDKKSDDFQFSLF